MSTRPVPILLVGGPMDGRTCFVSDPPPPEYRPRVAQYWPHGEMVRRWVWLCYRPRVLGATVYHYTPAGDAVEAAR